MFIFFFLYSTNISIIRFKDIKDIMFKYFVFIFLNILVDGWMDAYYLCFSLFQITVLVLQLGLSLFSLTSFLSFFFFLLKSTLEIVSTR